MPPSLLRAKVKYLKTGYARLHYSGLLQDDNMGFRIYSMHDYFNNRPYISFTD
ncbi:Uncharacterised protein r2_g3695 [Pycnogonum litorale]